MQLTAPVLWQNPSGIAAFLRSTGIAAANAIECAGRIVGIGGVSTTTTIAIYSPTAGWAKQNMAAGGNQAPKMMFAAPNGDIFFSLQYNAGFADSGQLWRIPAGSTTPAMVLDVRAASNWIQTMCADANGNLYATAYDQTVALYKSTDGGVTWAAIVTGTFPGSGYTPLTHLHVVVYDPYRNVLLCSSGDGASQYIQVSDCSNGNGGRSWSSWTLSQQAVGILPTPTSIIFGSDLSTDTGIYRAPVSGTGVAAVTAAVPVRTLNPVTDLGLATQASFGVGWEGYRDSFGYIVLPRAAVSVSGVAARCLVSPDDGITWYNFRSWAYAGSGTSDFKKNQTYFGYASPTGYLYGSMNAGSVGPGCVEWRILPSGFSVPINSLGGNQWANTGPWAEIPDYAWTGNINPNLTENYAQAGYFSQPGCAIRKNNYSFIGTTPTAPLFTNDCEAFPVSGGWTSSASAGPITTLAADAAIFKVGSNSIKMTTASGGGVLFGSIQKLACYGTDPVAQPQVWASMWFRWNTAASATNSAILSIENGGVDYVRVQQSATGVWQLRIRNNASGADDTFDTGVPYVPNTWVSLKLGIVRSATAGRVRFWINNVLAIDLRGLNTIGTNNYTDGKFGFSTAQNAVMQFNIDQCSVSYADPDQPSGVTFGDRTTYAIA